jgi:hypothetical protein
MGIKQRIIRIENERGAKPLKFVMLEAVYSGDTITHYEETSTGERYATIEDIEARYPDDTHMKILLTKA